MKSFSNPEQWQERIVHRCKMAAEIDQTIFSWSNFLLKLARRQATRITENYPLRLFVGHEALTQGPTSDSIQRGRSPLVYGRGIGVTRELSQTVTTPDSRSWQVWIIMVDLSTSHFHFSWASRRKPGSDSWRTMIRPETVS